MSSLRCSKSRRGRALGLDQKTDLRNSYENPAIAPCYQDYLGAPLSERAEKPLYTDHHAWQLPHEATRA